MEIGIIYSELQTSLLAYIRSKIKSKEDAEDILQNVFVKIAGNIRTLSDDKKLVSWIYSITRNAIIDYYRSNSSKAATSLTENLAEHLPDEDSIDDTKGLDQCLGGLIAKLPDDYSAIIRDSELAGISQKKLAEKYNMSYPTVRSRVQRGRARLKQLLTSCCQIETDKRGNIMDVAKKDDCADSCNSCS